MNNTHIIRSEYLPFVKIYVEYVEWLREQSYVNNYSLELFVFTYWEWAKQRSFFTRTKHKFLKYIQSITPKEKVVHHQNSASADNAGVLLSLVKGLAIKALKFRFSPLKLAMVTKGYIDIKPRADKHETQKVLDEKPQDNLWWYNINENIEHPLSYDKHQWQLLNPGDIIYEDEGFNRITGHTAMVEGIFYDTEKQVFYIRIIEAISPYGVTHGLIDDERYEQRAGVVLRMPNITTDEIIKLIAYAKSKIGQKYSLRFDAGNDQGEWYCSELIWMAYKHIGHDVLDRKGDLLSLKNIRDGVNMAYDITKSKNTFDLSKHINTMDLISISSGMVAPHELVDSNKLNKIEI